MADLKRGESFATGMVRPKTTALFFDKLWVHPYLIGQTCDLDVETKMLGLVEGGVPSELCVSSPLGSEQYYVAGIRNFCASGVSFTPDDLEKFTLDFDKSPQKSTAALGSNYIDESGVRHVHVSREFFHLIRDTLDDHVSTDEELLNKLISDFKSTLKEQYRAGRDRQPSGNVYLGSPIDDNRDDVMPWIRGLPTKYRNKAISNLVKLYAQKSIDLTPIYLNPTEYDEVSCPESPGIEICLDMIPVVIDSKLTWEQVLEFRRDKKAKEKFVRLRRWFSIDLLDKNEDKIRINLEKRLDDYSWALKKHGIKTLVAGTTSLLSFVAGPAAMQMLMSSPLAAVTGGLAIAGGAIAWISNKVIERTEIQRDEVAYIYEVRQLAGTAG